MMNKKQDLLKNNEHGVNKDYLSGKYLYNFYIISKKYKLYKCYSKGKDASFYMMFRMVEEDIVP